MKTKLFWGFSIFLAILLAGILASGQILTSLARNELKKFESEQLNIQFSAIKIADPMTPQFEINDLSIKLGDKNLTHWSFSVSKIKIQTTWESLRKKSYSIRSIEIFRPKVELSEKNDSPKTQSNFSLKVVPPFSIKTIKIKKAMNINLIYLIHPDTLILQPR